MKKRLLLRLVVCCLVSSSFVSVARASDDNVPDYPVEQLCKTVAKTSGGSELIYGGCVEQEQSSYDQLKESWSDVPRKTRTWCDQVAKASGAGSYMILKGCIEMEATAQKENATRQFHK